ncbi:MAG: alkaline phosphatase family protein [Acidobacteriota bacterium]
MGSLLLGLLLVLSSACGDRGPSGDSTATNTSSRIASPAASEPPPEGAPKLVLLLILDQCRGDLLPRYQEYLVSGLGRLLNESVSFTEAHHDHAITSTAPGHATLTSGTHPRRHGIVGNWWVDRETGESSAAVRDQGEIDGFTFTRSPRRLRVPTLGTWLKTRWPESRVWTVSSKDRGAIFSAGLDADGALWYDDGSGQFVGTPYYPAFRGTEPDWLEDANRASIVHKMFGEPWNLSEVLQDPETQRRLGLVNSSRYVFVDDFPHPLGGASLSAGGSFYEAIYVSPFADQAVGEIAQQIVVQEELGQDAWPDLLVVSFSSIDTVGHTWGPDSLESADTVLRLDQTVGDLLNVIDEKVGLENVLISLSADHGVLDLPELLTEESPPGLRFDAEEIGCFQRAQQELEARFPGGPWTLGGQTYLDREGIEAAGYDLSSVTELLRQHLETCPGVERIWHRDELLDEPPPGVPGDEEPNRLYAHSFDPQRSPDLLVQIQRNALSLRSIGTNHGTPYRYDTHVPWLIRLHGKGPQGKIVDVPVATVDVAPTLADLLGIEPTGEIDGVSRRNLAGIGY